MPCYDCSMLGYSTTCTSCSPFLAGTPPITPSSPANQNTFNFDLSAPPANIFSVTEPPFAPKYSITVIAQPRSPWTNLETAEPSTKTSRFNWSEMGFSNDQNTFENLTRSSVSPKSNYDKPYPECPVCSLVPYGALCTSCNRIQTSKITPPTTFWPIPPPFCSPQDTTLPEEELLQNLDMQLFEQINVPHELDVLGRRVYDDSGNRLYYQDEDGNTVIEYEAWYPSSVIDDREEDTRDCHPNNNNHVHDAAAADYKPSYAAQYVCARPIMTYINDDDDTTIISGNKTWYSCPKTINYNQEEPPDHHYDSDSSFEFEQQRFAEFLAARDDELPRFASDRERVAKWIENAYVVVDDGDGDDGSEVEEEVREEEYVFIQDLDNSDVVSLWSEIY